MNVHRFTMATVAIVAFAMLAQSPFVLAQDSSATSAASATNDSIQGLKTQDTQARTLRQAELDRQHAQQWGLSLDEWQRYQTLLQGIDGYRSDKLDPLTLLGIYARSNQERQHYARRLARMEHDRIDKVLSFQRAYDRAFAALYPNEKLVKTQQMFAGLDRGPREARRLGLEHTRKAVIVRARDCTGCVRTVQRLAAAHTLMDIYVVGADDDDAIRAWARKAGLDAKRVRNGEVTLNHAPQALADEVADITLPRVLDR